MAGRLALAALIAVVAALVWDSAQATDPPSTVIESQHITAHATHDTVHVSWDTGASDVVYNVLLYRHHEYWTYHGFAWGPSGEFVVGPHAPYELTINGLDPNSIYVVEVYEGDWHDRNSGFVYVRTEPVPEHWWEVNIARNFKTSVHGNAILVGWDCLRPPLVEELVVAIKEYGAPRRVVRSRSAACAANGMLSEPVQRGTTYEVAIQPVDMEHYQKKLIAKIPSSIHESETLEEDIPPWDISVEYSDEVRGWAFTVSVDDDDSTSLFEVEWNRDGYRMTRVGAGPELIYYSDSPGPFPFRVRRVAGQSVLSQWSGSRLASVEPRPPRNHLVRYQPRGADLHITWWHGWLRSGIDGYRAYLFGEGNPPQVVDTGLSRYTVFEIAPDLSRYVLLIGAYRNDLGLGDLTRIEVDLERQPKLLLQVDKWQPYCWLDSGDPMKGFWSIKYGVPPYRVAVGTQEPVHSLLPHGEFESGCTAAEGEWADDGALVTQVPVEVEDGLGRRVNGSLSYRILGHHEVSAARVAAVNKPGPVELRVSKPIVGSTGLGVVVEERSFDAHDWGSRFVIRWRLPGQRGWNYERDSVEVMLTRFATVLWKGLIPDTSYEFQVAVDFPGIHVEEIPEEAWSSLQEVRTWPAQIHAEVVRVGTSITVRWKRGANESGYSVVLRGEGESWWKRHYPNGTDTESVVFEGIPVDAVIEVEVMTPPVGAPSWDGYRG